MKTLTFAAGAAVGYVLGTKAGREKYQQIVDGARSISQKPVVRQAQSKIKDLVGPSTTAVSDKLGTGNVDTTDGATASFDSGTTNTTTRTAPEKTAPSATSAVDAAFPGIDLS